jgi:Retinol binding protein receptor
MYEAKKKAGCMPRKLRLPVFFDMVTDRVRSRLLLTILISLVFIAVLEWLLVRRYRDPVDVAMGVGELSKIDLFVWPSSRGAIGVPVDEQPQLQVRNSVLAGIGDISIRLRVRRIFVGTDQWLADLNHVMCNVYDDDDNGNSVGLDDGSLGAMQMSTLCQHAFIDGGDVARTNDYGIARFDQFGIEFGPDGVYEIEFYATPGQRQLQGGSIQGAFAYVTFASPVAKLVDIDADFYEGTDSAVPCGATVGATLAPFSVLLLDLRGRPVPNKRAQILSVPRLLNSSSASLSTGRWLRPRALWLDDLRPTRVVLLDGASVRSGDDGVARFDSVRIVASNFASQYLAVVVDGHAINVQLDDCLSHIDTLQPTRVRTDVTSVALHDGAPKSVRELEPFDMRVTVSGGDGRASNRPLSKRTVFAMLSLWNGTAWAPTAQYASTFLVPERARRTLEPHKRLVGTTTALSGSDGVARFRALAFSSDGVPGAYRIEFLCDGELSGAVLDVDVRTSVASVTPQWWLNSKLSPVYLTQPLLVLPRIQLADKHGESVSGKLVERVDFYLPSGDVDADVVFQASALASDALGIVEYTSMRFLRARLDTLYSVVFVVDGVASSVQVLLNVSSDVESSPSSCVFLDVGADALPTRITVGEPFDAFTVRAVGTSPLWTSLSAGSQVRAIASSSAVPYELRNDVATVNESGVALFEALTVVQGYATRLELDFVIERWQECCDDGNDDDDDDDDDDDCEGCLVVECRSGSDASVALDNAVAALHLVSLDGDTPLDGIVERGQSAQFSLLLVDSANKPALDAAASPRIANTSAIELVLAPSDLLRGFGTLPSAELFDGSMWRNASADDAIYRVRVTPSPDFPGNWAFALNVAGVAGPLLSFNVRSPLAHVEPWCEGGVGVVPLVPLGERIEPAALLLDAGGAPLRGLRVAAYDCAKNFSASFIGSLDDGSPWSEPSDEHGVARFASLAIWQRTSGVAELCFGAVLFESPSNWRAARVVESHSATSSFDSVCLYQSIEWLYIDVDRQPPLTASLGAPFRRAPRLRALATLPELDDIAAGTPPSRLPEWWYNGSRPLDHFVASASACGLDTFWDSVFDGYRESPPAVELAPRTSFDGGVRDFLMGRSASFVALNKTTLSLDSLTLTRASSGGSFALDFVVPGMPPNASGPTRSRAIEMVPFPLHIVVEQQPPETVVVGQRFSVRVQVRAMFGGGMPGRLVRVYMLGDGNAQLNRSLAAQVTDLSGRATFDLIVRSGVTGASHELVFAQTQGYLSLIGTRPSRNFLLANRVHSLSFERTPRGLWRRPIWWDPIAFILGGDRDRYVLENDDHNVAVASMRQPVVCVRDVDGNPIAGIAVRVLDRGTVQQFEWDRARTTGSDGCMHFRQLRVSSTLSGAFVMTFDADGVRAVSEPVRFFSTLYPPQSSLSEAAREKQAGAADGSHVDEQDVEVDDENEDLESYASFFMAALLVPLLFANSLFVNTRAIVVVSLVLGSVVLAWFVAARSMQLYALSLANHVDGFQLSFQIFAFLFLLGGLGCTLFIVVCFVSRRDHIYFFEYRRMRMLMDHVRNLFKPDYDVVDYDHNATLGPRMLLAAERGWLALKRYAVTALRGCPCCQAALSKCSCCACCCDSSPTSTRKKWRHLVVDPYHRCSSDDEACDDGSDDDIDDDDDDDDERILIVDGDDNEDKKSLLVDDDDEEEEEERAYGDDAHEILGPMRARAAGIDYAANPRRLARHTGCGWTLRNMCCTYRKRDALTESQYVYPQRFLLALAVSLIYAAVAFMASIFFVRTFLSFLVYAEKYLVFGGVWVQRFVRFAVGDSQVSAYVFNTYVDDNVVAVWQLLLDFVADIKHRFAWTGYASAGIALLVLFLLFIDIIAAYRRLLLRFRFGEMRRDFNEHAFHIGNASRYCGVQGGHAVLGYLMLFFALWIVLLLLSSSIFRHLIWRFLVDIYFYVLGLHLVLTVIRVTVVNFVLTHGFDIRFPRVFALWDLINSLAEIVAGLSTTLLRLGVAIGGIVVGFPRIHVPLLGWESLHGFDAGYASFISMVYVDHYYNNAVLNVFIYHLLAKQRRRRSVVRDSRFSNVKRRLDQWSDFFQRKRHAYTVIKEAEDDDDIDDEEQDVSSDDIDSGSSSAADIDIEPKWSTGALKRHRARLRWHLAYTLLRNPTIRADRRVHGKKSARHAARNNLFRPPPLSSSSSSSRNDEAIHEATAARRQSCIEILDVSSQ